MKIAILKVHEIVKKILARIIYVIYFHVIKSYWLNQPM